MSVGLIFPLKGQLDLIEAAAIVRETVPDLEVRLYGSASDRGYFDECEARVRHHGLENTVMFAGSTTAPWEVYGLADVVAMTSISEAFPYTAIEAMLCGASIVATDVGGVSEALGPAGRLVNARDPKAMAAAICTLLASSSERKRLGDAARARALEHFTEDKFVGHYRAAYQSFGAPADEARRRGHPTTPAARKPALVMRPRFANAESPVSG